MLIVTVTMHSYSTLFFTSFLVLINQPSISPPQCQLLKRSETSDKTMKNDHITKITTSVDICFIVYTMNTITVCVINLLNITIIQINKTTHLTHVVLNNRPQLSTKINESQMIRKGTLILLALSNTREDLKVYIKCRVLV